MLLGEMCACIFQCWVGVEVFVLWGEKKKIISTEYCLGSCQTFHCKSLSQVSRHFSDRTMRCRVWNLTGTLDFSNRPHKDNKTRIPASERT